MAKIELQDFYQELYQNSFIGFEADVDSSKSDMFREMIGGYLEEDGDLEDITWAEYNQKDLEFSGYSFDPERGLLTIIGDHFFQGEEIETLTKDLYERDFKKLTNFYVEATNSQSPLYYDMAPGDSAASIAKYIFDCRHNNKIKRVVFFLLTNGLLSRNTSTIPYREIDGIHCDYQVYDLNQVYQTVMNQQNAQIIVDFNKFGAENGITCIRAVSGEFKDYDSYLVVMPGNVLAKIYDCYGQKLLEQNVRTFLQLKGKTNKNMLATIKYQPERFFIYNNGLTCTASSVELSADGENLKIRSLEGLQIVNGGQTSSVIYKASCEGTDLSKVFVQMKLSVINNPEHYDEIVASVARYANTQNPVKDADFFSNSPFNKGFYDVAKNCWTPMVGGRQYKTLWFYERTRGLYLNEKAKYIREGREKEFLKKYPKEQLIDKIIIAKTEMIFSGRPYASVKQNNAFPLFAADIAKLTDGKTDYAVTPQYFMSMIGKIILVNNTDELIASQAWAKGMRSVRAYIKAYTLAILNSYVEKKGMHLNFQDIWDRQAISSELTNAVEICMNAVYERISNYSDSADLREKLGRAYTWEDIQTITVTIPDDILDRICISEEQKKKNDSEERLNKKALSEAKKQETIVRLSVLDWQALTKFYNENKGLCTGTNSFGLLDRMSRKPFYPTKKVEIECLYNLIETGRQHGVLSK